MPTSERDLTRALVSKSAPFVDELRDRIDCWKPRRKDTIQALRDLATKYDEKVTRNNKVKLVGTGTAMVGTLGGLAVPATGGLAAPLLAGGWAVLVICGTVVRVVADHRESVCQEEAHEKAQKTIDKENNAYEDVRLVTQELQHTLKSTSVDHGWPQEEGLDKLLSVNCKVEVGGITIQGGKEGARKLRAALAATELMEAVASCAKVAAGAKVAAAGAKVASGTKMGSKALGKTIPVLKVAFLINDAMDAAEAGMQLARGESKAPLAQQSKENGRRGGLCGGIVLASAIIPTKSPAHSTTSIMLCSGMLCSAMHMLCSAIAIAVQNTLHMHFVILQETGMSNQYTTCISEQKSVQ